MLTKPASPMPSQTPVSSRTEMAASSPPCASSVTSSPSTFLSMASRPRAESGRSLATSRARRWIAVPDARASRQPWLPQPQRGPVAWMVTCPSSAPAPCAPRSRMLSVITPPPTPVPSVIKTRWPTSLPAPNRNSPQAAAFASFSTVTESPVLPSISSFRGTPSIACRLGAKTTLFSLVITKPGIARQTPPTSNPSFTSMMARAMLESSLSRGPADGYLTSFKISPAGVTTPAAIFVPPTSTPIAFNLTALPIDYLELRCPGVSVPAHRVRCLECPRRHRPFRSGKLRRNPTPKVQEVHSLPQLPRVVDAQPFSDEDRATITTPERCKPLVPVQETVGYVFKRELCVDLYGRSKKLRILLELRPHRLVHPGHEGVKVARRYREACRFAMPTPPSQEVPHPKERPIKIHIRLSGAS